MLRRVTATLMAAALLIGLTACTPSPTPNAIDLTEFEGTSWELVAGTVDGETLKSPTTHPITITFEEFDGAMRLAGLACNSLVGKLNDWPRAFSVGELAQTERGCPNDAMLAAETALSVGLVRVDQLEGDASAITLTGDGVTFELRAADDAARSAEVAAAFEALVDTDWQLVSGTVDGTPIDPGAAFHVTMRITRDAEGAFHLGGRACNGWRIPLSDIDGGTVLPGSTERGCHDPLANAERAVASAIPRLTAVIRDDDTVSLWGEGVELHWEEREPLDLASVVDVRWSVQTMRVEGGAPEPVLDGTVWTLGSDGTLTGTSDCLVFTGEWEAAATEVVVGRFSIEGTCGKPGDPEVAYGVNAFGLQFSASVEGGVLTTQSSGGVVATHVPAS